MSEVRAVRTSHVATMTDNRNPEAAWAYHDATKHSYTSVRSNPHFLDWANQPAPFKIYPTLEPLSLPREVRQTGVAALSAIAESNCMLPCKKQVFNTSSSSLRERITSGKRGVAT